MKQIFVAMVFSLTLTSAFAIQTDNLHPSTNAPLFQVAPSQLYKQHAIKKKPFLKQKLLLRWLRKRSAVDQQEKSIKILGVLSFGLSLLGVLFFLLGTLTTLSDLAVVAIGIFFIAFILGLVALIKRAKLKDKSGTKRWPALLGIIIGLGFILGLVIALLIYLNT